jgi:hypothetical protein
MVGILTTVEGGVMLVARYKAGIFSAPVRSMAIRHIRYEGGASGIIVSYHISLFVKMVLCHLRYSLRTKAAGDVAAQADRLKVDRLAEHVP